MKNFSARARTTILVCVVIVMLVALFHTSSWRDGRLLNESFAALEEGFVDIEQVKTLKSEKYWMAGFKYFYSDGRLMLPDGRVSTTANGDMFFTPSKNDMVCKLGSQDLLRVCDSTQMRIDNVSRRDTTTLVQPSFNCTRMVDNTSQEPMDSDDCNVRILNNMYTFVKMCISVTVMLGSNDRDGNETLRFDPSDYGTKVFMLSRPIFITGPLCALTTPTNLQSTVFDSSVRSPYVVSVKTITDTNIWNMSDPGSSFLSFVKNILIASNGRIMSNADADAKAKSTPVVLPITMYYLNYSSDLGNSRPTQADNNVITLYIPTFGTIGRMFSSRSFSVTMTAETFTVSVSGRKYTVDTPKNGHVILTYTTTLLIVVSLSKERIRINHFTGLPALKAADDDVATAKLLHPSNQAMYPYTNECIPNFADLAIKLGYL